MKQNNFKKTSEHYKNTDFVKLSSDSFHYYDKLIFMFPGTTLIRKQCWIMFSTLEPTLGKYLT